MALSLQSLPRVTVGELQTAERRPAWVGFSALTVIMAAHAVMETARDSLFLSGVPASRLPYAYLAIAALSWGVLRANGRLFARMRDKRRLLASTLAGIGTVDLVFWAALSPSHRGGLFALYIWSAVVATVATVQFWLLLDDAVTVAQAKRVFGPVAAGGVAGALLGALLARVLVAWAEPRHLLLMAALLWFGAAALPRHLGLDLVPRERASGPPTRGRTRGAGVLLRRGYLRRLLAFVVVATTAVTGIDYVFKAQAAATLPAGELAGFFASFYVGLNATALVVQLFVSGSLLRRVGVNRALAVMPSLLLAFATLFAWAPGMGAAILLRGTDGAMRHSLHRTGVEILYLPLAGEARARIKAVVDGLGHRGGQALASVMLLGATSLGLGMREIGWVLVGLLVAWLVSLLRIRVAYLDLFRASFDRRPEPHPALPELDLGGVETLVASLNSEDDRRVLTAIDLLAANEKTRLLPHVLVHHRSRRVVLRALEAFARDRTLGAADAIESLLASPDPELRAAALRALVAIDPRSHLVRSRMAHDPSAGVRATVLVGAVVAGEEGAEALRARLVLAARNGSPSTRSAIAAAVRAQPFFDSPELLVALLAAGRARESVAVSREVLLAMTAHPDPRFVPTLLPLLARGATRPLARRALRAIGEPALRALAEALGRDDAPRRLRRHLPATIARFGGQPAADALLGRLLREEDGLVANRILRALRHVRDEDPDVRLDRDALDGAMQSLLARCLELVSSEVACEAATVTTPTSDLLLGAVREEQATAMSSIFFALDLLRPDEGFDAIRRGIASDDRRVRDAAREVLEHAVTGDTRRALLALVEEGSTSDRWRRLRRALGVHVRRASYEARLAAMLEDGSEALRAIAAERIGELGLIGLMGALRRARVRRVVEDSSREAIDRALAALNASLTRRLPGVA